MRPPQTRQNNLDLFSTFIQLEKNIVNNTIMVHSKEN